MTVQADGLFSFQWLFRVAKTLVRAVMYPVGGYVGQRSGGRCVGRGAMRHSAIIGQGFLARSEAKPEGLLL
jgi:hypothetical protein